MVGHGLGFGPIEEIVEGLWMMINDFLLKYIFWSFSFGMDIYYYLSVSK